ncbi:hypothetical protein [Tomitella gaofuii]|uniref:hypothetical protein n=1 Tax=Tomitella gaofuii TaxID=2760083 RepID=UPI0015FC221F|nr:hypothetical protein [Tomitella gaofuii]
MVLLTITGWVLLGGTTGWHTGTFVTVGASRTSVIHATLGVLGGLAGGAAIRFVGIGPSDPGWLLSLFTCALGAVAVVMGTAAVMQLAARSRLHGGDRAADSTDDTEHC